MTAFRSIALPFSGARSDKVELQRPKHLDTALIVCAARPSLNNGNGMSPTVVLITLPFDGRSCGFARRCCFRMSQSELVLACRIVRKIFTQTAALLNLDGATRNQDEL